MAVVVKMYENACRVQKSFMPAQNAPTVFRYVFITAEVRDTSTNSLSFESTSFRSP